MDRNRQFVLGGLLAVLIVVSLATLFEIANVVVFAITVAYVLYPFRQWLTDHGLSRRLASAVSTLVAFLAVVALLAPLVYIIYERRNELVNSLSRIPETISVDIGEWEYVVETDPFIDTVEAALTDLAVDIALAAPRLVLELAVFALLLYGILYRPGAIGVAMYELVPESYHDVLTRLHERTQTTLFSIYVVQASTAVSTFAIAFVLFSALGFSAPLSLAVVAGIFQFVPIVGPSVLIVLLAANEFVLGFTTRAALVLVVGLVFVSFVPDAVIRTKLASKAGEIASSLYFVGFVGGILTIGAIGIIVGPLVIALLVEVVRLLSENNRSGQARLTEEAEGVDSGDDPVGDPRVVGDGGEQKSP